MSTLFGSQNGGAGGPAVPDGPSLSSYQGGPGKRSDKEKEPSPELDPSEVRRVMNSVSSDAAAHAEVEDLKGRLARQNASMLETMKTVDSLQNELKQTRAEVVRTRSQTQTMQSGKSSEIADRDSEIAFIKTQFVRTKTDLEREQRRRQSEVALAEEKATRLEQQLSAAKLAANRLADTRAGKKKMRMIAMCAAAAVLFIGGGVLAFTRFASSAPAGHESPRTALPGDTLRVAETLPSPVSLPNTETHTPSRRVPPDSSAGPASLTKSADFTQSVDRLSRDLDSYPGISPEAVLLAVNKKLSVPGSPVCSFGWQNGSPALVFDAGKRNTLSASISRCAEAVEKYRQQ